MSFAVAYVLIIMLCRNWSSRFYFWSSHCTGYRSKVRSLEETKEVAWYNLEPIF